MVNLEVFVHKTNARISTGIAKTLRVTNNNGKVEPVERRFSKDLQINVLQNDKTDITAWIFGKSSVMYRSSFIT